MLFAVSSSSMVVSNKVAALTVVPANVVMDAVQIIMHAFPFPMTLLLIQNTISVVLTLVLALTGHGDSLLSSHLPKQNVCADAFTMKPWDSKHLITWLLPTITFSIMLMTRSVYAARALL